MILDIIINDLKFFHFLDVAVYKNSINFCTLIISSNLVKLTDSFKYFVDYFGFFHAQVSHLK